MRRASKGLFSYAAENCSSFFSTATAHKKVVCVFTYYTCVIRYTYAKISCNTSSWTKKLHFTATYLAKAWPVICPLWKIWVYFMIIWRPCDLGLDQSIEENNMFDDFYLPYCMILDSVRMGHKWPHNLGPTRNKILKYKKNYVCSSKSNSLFSHKKFIINAITNEYVLNPWPLQHQSSVQTT